MGSDFPAANSRAAMTSTAERSQFSATGEASSMASRISGSERASARAMSCQAAVALVLPFPSGPTERSVWRALVADAAKDGAGRQSASRARSQQSRRSGFINLLGGSKTHGGMQLFKSSGYPEKSLPAPLHCWLNLPPN